MAGAGGSSSRKEAKAATVSASGVPLEEGATTGDIHTADKDAVEVRTRSSSHSLLFAH